MRKIIYRVCASSLLLVFSISVQAERADREKPIHLEADRMSIDDIKKVKILDGNVVLTQGTTEIRTSHLVVTQDADGFQKGVATGGANGLARFKQKRDGRDDYVEGEAERIEHDARSEKTDFYIRAWVKSGLDEARGPFISYDSLNEQYVVNAGSGTAKTAGTTAQARARAIIQPKTKSSNSPTTTPVTKGEPLHLRPAQTVTPRSE